MLELFYSRYVVCSVCSEQVVLLYSRDVCCVCLEHIVLLYSRDVLCCVCLEQVVLLYNRDVFCVFGEVIVTVQ